MFFIICFTCNSAFIKGGDVILLNACRDFEVAFVHQAPARDRCQAGSRCAHKFMLPSAKEERGDEKPVDRATVHKASMALLL